MCEKVLDNCKDSLKSGIAKEADAASQSIQAAGDDDGRQKEVRNRKRGWVTRAARMK